MVRCPCLPISIWLIVASWLLTGSVVSHFPNIGSFFLSFSVLNSLDRVELALTHAVWSCLFVAVMAKILADSRIMSGHLSVSLPNNCTANAWVNCKFLLHARGELFKDWASPLQLSLCALDRLSIWFYAWRQVWRKEMCLLYVNDSLPSLNV